MDESDLGRWVVPFYLETMGLNAVDASSALLEDLVAVGSTLNSSNIIDLLNGGWRGVAVGSWYALLSNDARVHEAVLATLARSNGDLTAPGLCVTAIVLTGEGCVEALCEYARRDLEKNFGRPGSSRRRSRTSVRPVAAVTRTRTTSVTSIACWGWPRGSEPNTSPDTAAPMASWPIVRTSAPHRVGRKGATSCAQVNVIGGGACAGRSIRATYEPQ